MKKNKMLYRIVAAVLACAVVALALVTYQSRSSSNAPVAEGAVTATGSAKGMEGDVVVEVTADATTMPDAKACGQDSKKNYFMDVMIPLQ